MIGGKIKGSSGRNVQFIVYPLPNFAPQISNGVKARKRWVCPNIKFPGTSLRVGKGLSIERTGIGATTHERIDMAVC